MEDGKIQLASGVVLGPKGEKRAPWPAPFGILSAEPDAAAAERLRQHREAAEEASAARRADEQAHELAMAPLRRGVAELLRALGANDFKALRRAASSLVETIDRAAPGSLPAGHHASGLGAGAVAK